MREHLIQVYELDEDRTSNGRENASTAFARESRAPTGGSEESVRGKRAREREECKRTAEGSSEKEAHLIRVEGNGRETRWWCDRAPLRRCCTYVRGSLYEFYVHTHTHARRCTRVRSWLSSTRGLPLACWQSHDSPFCVNAHLRSLRFSSKKG